MTPERAGLHGITTAHGTVLALDRATRRLRHLPLATVAAPDLVFVSGLDRPHFGTLGSDDTWQPLDPASGGASRATGALPPRLAYADGLAAFRFGSHFLSAPPDGHVLIHAHEAHDWEHFGLVERAALLGVVAASRSEWLRLDTGERVGRGDVALAAPGHVRLGAHHYPIAGNFPLHAIASGRRRNTLHRDAWKVDGLLEYRPLVYFVLMGEGPYAEQLRLATASLHEFGTYDGDVLVITDREPALIAELVPAALLAGLAVLPVASSDKVDAVIARLMLGEHAGARGHAPILYSDTDIVFDRPLHPFLERIRLGERMSAQTEHWNELPDSLCCGAELFAADPTPRATGQGFNAGVWAMPGGPDSVDTVDAIRRSIGAYLHAHGRDSLPWLDQAMANYVLRKIDGFDPEPVTGATRLAQSGHPVDADDRRGFVHFWPVSFHPDERAAAMADYLGRLRDSGEATAG